MSDFSNEAYLARMAVVEAAQAIQFALTAPHVLMRPKIYPDGNQWCALYGDNLQEGLAGFGDTPELAAQAFDDAWRASNLKEPTND